MEDIARPAFDPVDTSFDPAAVSARDDVESPSLSSGSALARFEFEPGRSKEGTKVLMVEWEDDATTAAVEGDWEISWEGKRTTLPAKGALVQQVSQKQSSQSQQQPQSPSSPSTKSDPNNSNHPVNRFYFLLGPGVPVPGTIQLSKGTSVNWKTNPLPAIFPPELGATARQAGKKGVLHTVWAKKRLQVLSSEISTELRENAEGIALQMAMAEKDWIEHNFGVTARPANIAAPGPGAIDQGAASPFAGPNAPASPRSPGGGRLMDKLKGLRLGTSAQELAGSTAAGETLPSGADVGSDGIANPLSPETSDVAVGGGVFGSFAALKGSAPPASSQSQQQQQQPQRRIAAQVPPDSLLAAQQPEQGGNMGSLNAFASIDQASGRKSYRAGGITVTPVLDPRTKASPIDDDDVDEAEKDDLFALPMSPRSPEMTKSPFSFGTSDTMRYLHGEKAS